MFENCYTSSNSNQTPTIAHWGKNNLICYGSCNSVMIYDPYKGSGGKVVQTLISHKKRVNSVRWLESNNFENELISGSSDNTAIVWTLKENKYAPFILTGHTSNVNIVDGIYKAPNNDKAVVVTVSMDCTVKIWYRENYSGDFGLHATLNFGHSICVGLRITLIPETKIVLLACALDDSKVHLYIENESSNCDEIKFAKSSVISGHEDWVRGLDFTSEDNGDLLLASSSQDNFIRLWRITSKIYEKLEMQAENKRNANVIQTKSKRYKIYLESVLSGHEGWIYSVNWNPNKQQLLSASLDKSMIIWEYDEHAEMWLEKIRVGEVGGNTLGFYGGLFSPDGLSVLAHSYHGAFHIWKSDECGMWNPQVTVGGHFNEVVDLCWEPQGEYLMSVSTDQTTRIHAPWKRNAEDKATWHELARPQVHGYDMSALAIISRYKFASASEEKIIRTFEAPRNFVDNFRRICNVSEDIEGNSLTNYLDSGPKGASVPSLGLSNKAVYSDDNNEQSALKSEKDFYPEESHFTAVDFNEPPTEETLLQNTLWPEIQKLYGHGYEVYSLAASPDGKLLASSCKATNLEHASLLLWDTTEWKQIQKLTSHTLTVAQISFSPNSEHVLSVSRDRRWSLFSKNSKTNEYELVATTDKKTSIHTRIIWCCCWSHDSKYFATGSRDGKVVVWTKNENKSVDSVLGQYEAASNHLELKNDSVTAICFAQVLVDNYYLIAVGLESGFILLYKWNTTNWVKCLVLNESNAHHLTVRRICFRPVLGEAGNKQISTNIIQLASCSSDSSVKITNIFLDRLNDTNI